MFLQRQITCFASSLALESLKENKNSIKIKVCIKISKFKMFQLLANEMQEQYNASHAATRRCK